MLPPPTAVRSLLQRELRASIGQPLRRDAHLGAPRVRAHRERRTRQPAIDRGTGREESRPREHAFAPAALGLALLQRELHAPVGQQLRSDAHLGFVVRSAGEPAVSAGEHHQHGGDESQAGENEPQSTPKHRLRECSTHT